MRSLLAIAAAIVVGTIAPDRAMAMATAAPIARDAVIEQIVSVCGVRGCVPVQTKRIIHHQKPGNTVPHHV